MAKNEEIPYKLALIDKILHRRAKIGVIGLGYVGLPLAVCFAQAGFSVTGIDLDGAKIQSLQKGENYIPDVSNAQVKRLVKKGKLQARQDFDTLGEMDAISICVPTPLSKSRDPDISYIVECTQEIRQRLKKEQVIILESTTYPGTTEEVILPELEETGLKVGKDFFLAFSPERIDPANKTYGLKNTPKVLGGITKNCTKVGTLLYRAIINEVIAVQSARTAEMVKLLENTFRAVNIGLVNEIAQICDKLDIPTWEVIDAAASKPFGFMPFYPGPGLGGHCLPIDPHYLSWKLRTLNYTTRFIELASEINSEMPQYVFSKIQSALNNKMKPVKGSKILLLGVAYKKNVSDVRESPAFDVAKLLHQAGAHLTYSDPYVPQWDIDWGKLKSHKITPASLKKADCVVILTNHDDFNIKSVVKNAKIIVDTRNATGGLPQKKVVQI